MFHYKQVLQYCEVTATVAPAVAAFEEAWSLNVVVCRHNKSRNNSSNIRSRNDNDKFCVLVRVRGFRVSGSEFGVYLD